MRNKRDEVVPRFQVCFIFLILDQTSKFVFRHLQGLILVSYFFANHYRNKYSSISFEFFNR